MELIKKYFWVALLVIAFVLGMLISKGPDKELINKFETEREVHRQGIEVRDRKIKALDSLQATIRKRMIQDSLRFSSEIKAKETRIMTLQIRLKDAEKFKGASVPTLDSLRNALYGSKSLHSARAK